ncbi:MAG: magnesium transporter CorA family protein [Helicobacteraceae bacterium]|nr:magnesium transporter CorA family protein [Helicobacteraceae bacterium]
MKSTDILSSIHSLHLSDIKNKQHSSYFFHTPEYSLLIIRFFFLEDEGLSGISTPYLIHNDSLYIYDRSRDAFDLYEKLHEDIHNSIHHELKKSEALVLKYIQEVDNLEDQLYMRKLSPIFLDVWFDLKKDITRMERMLERAYEAIEDYMEVYATKEGFPNNGFNNIMEHIQRNQRVAALNSTKLDTLYNYYNSLKSDKMNSNIYALTILSGIFLPLNLIVGFFGINTEGLFFSGNPSGTMYVIYILVSVFIVFVALFPLMAILERYILRKLLGKLNLTQKLDAIIG